MARTIIGIAGRKFHGKSTVAGMLRGTRMSFANPIKEMLAVLGLPLASLYGDAKEVPQPLLDGQTARWAMQSLGTDWGRNMLTRNLWMNVLRKRIEEDPSEIIIIDDVRFESEVKMIQDLGGFILAVQRERPPPWWKRLFLHESERLDFDKYQIPVIQNTGTVDELRISLARLLNANHLGWVMQKA